MEHIVQSILSGHHLSDKTDLISNDLESQIGQKKDNLTLLKVEIVNNLPCAIVKIGKGKNEHCQLLTDSIFWKDTIKKYI